MLKKIANRWLILAILGCLVAVIIRNPFVYVPTFMILVAAILFGLLVRVMDLIWKLLPADVKETYEGKRGHFNAVFFLGVILFYIIAGIIDVILLSDVRGFVSLLGNAATFVLAVFLGWSLIRRTKARTFIAGSVVFILFIGSLSFVSSNPLKSGRIAAVSSLDKLKSLGYVAWVDAEKDIEKTGVTQYDPELAFEGLNLYNARAVRDVPEVHLIDMQGNIVHKWPPPLPDTYSSEVSLMELCKNGDILVVAGNRKLICLDWDSNVKWKKEIQIHHDITVSENGEICALVREYTLVFWRGIPVPMDDDYIAVLTPDGEIKRKIYFYELVKDQVPLRKIVKIYRGFLKIFQPKNVLRICLLRIFECVADVVPRNDRMVLHSNTVEIMDRDIEGFCRKGDYLTAIRNLDLIGVIDAEKGEFVWSWGPGELSRPHHPRLLENGNVLIFDNGVARGFSRIVELNPLTKRIVWQYISEPPEQFYSSTMGTSQRLPNGNTLIVESRKGRVFEITKEGKIVWEFYNPEVRIKDKKRGTIYRMVRIVDPKIHKVVEERTGKTYY